MRSNKKQNTHRDDRQKQKIEWNLTKTMVYADPKKKEKNFIWAKKNGIENEGGENYPLLNFALQIVFSC